MYKIRIFLFFSAFTICFLLEGQEENIRHTFNRRNNTVLAQSGLNIRSKPNTKSEIVGKIPYGEKVQFLHKDHYGYQKLNSIQTKTKSYLIDGIWIKVQYNNLQGYVLSTFLYNPYEYENEYKYDEFVLLLPGIGCSDNIHYINEYNWYGLYQNKDMSSLKKIKFEFYNTMDRMTNMQIVAKEDKDLMFIIGSKTALNTFDERIAEIYKNTHPYDLRPYPCDTTFQLTKNIIAEYSVEHSGGVNGDFNLFVKNGSGWQEFYPFDEVYNFTNFVQYAGDIDSDGKDDYIISYEGKPAYTILFLSSKAKIGKSIKDVACFYSTYCC